MPAFSCTTFEQFEKHYGPAAAEGVLTRICEAGWAPSQLEPGIKELRVHEHNACNHTYEGVLEYDGIAFSFVVDNGDWNGTEVREFTTEDAAGYEAPRPALYVLVPEKADLRATNPAMYSVYLHWTRTSWFADIQRGYNYDKHFQPGVKTEQHYRDKARQHGLKFVQSDDVQARQAQADVDAKFAGNAVVH
jgi:hypothetical protein